MPIVAFVQTRFRHGWLKHFLGKADRSAIDVTPHNLNLLQESKTRAGSLNYFEAQVLKHQPTHKIVIFI